MVPLMVLFHLAPSISSNSFFKQCNMSWSFCCRKLMVARALSNARLVIHNSFLSLAFSCRIRYVRLRARAFSVFNFLISWLLHSCMKYLLPISSAFRSSMPFLLRSNVKNDAERVNKNNHGEHTLRRFPHRGPVGH